jgi:hypothetical protein
MIKRYGVSFLMQVSLIFACSLVAKAQENKSVILAKPTESAEETALRKLLAIAKDPLNNGLVLMDTISPNNTVSVGHATTVPLPGAMVSQMLTRDVRYNGNLATVNYTWRSVIAEIAQGDTLSLNRQLGRLQELLFKVMPGVRDSFSTTTDANSTLLEWRWNAGKQIFFILKANTRKKYNLPDEVALWFSVSKTLVQNQARIIDSIYAKYTQLTKDAASRKDATSYCISLFNFMEQEGLTRAEAIEKIKPLFKFVADRDIAAGFDVMIKLPMDAILPFRALLTAEQLAAIGRLTQGVIDDFAKSQYGTVNPTPKPEPAVQKPVVKSRFTFYHTLYKNTVTKRYMYVISLDDSLHKFTIQEAWIEPKRYKTDRWSLRKSISSMVAYSFFEPAAQWQAVDVHNCYSCDGSGVLVTRTPYTYYVEEKGIYNKYTYSGSGVNVSSRQCDMCYGAGYTETILRF